ncbi:SLC13 family permease [Enterovibrio sp. ZSDZ35]|uniref:SLC13 family permease n=1 Tax=Enterovibrio qingdaonensis TaxID=2899818 RepID=A0ABT5QNV5_9GAMM|nr:SLC13 family permease [Enterovibrio sp. ZSDZ35]MDD1782175.1 SLC13 family permease [Enterovibrio sp. ZSDZ35]
MAWAVGLLILFLLVTLLLTELRPALVFGMVFIALLLLDIVPAEQLFSNFVNPALIVLVLLVLMSVVLERTTLVSQLGAWCTKGNLRGVTLRTTLSAGLLSAFINNTAVVAALMQRIANSQHSTSKLLIPLSYAAILGGTMTLIGTSTNLLVNGFTLNADLPELGFFDFSLVGVPLFLMGLAIIVLVSLHLLPGKKAATEGNAENYFLEAQVAVDSPLVGQTIEAIGLRHLEQLFLVEIVRHHRCISPVSPSEPLQGGDTLVFSGDINATSLLSRFSGLSLYTEHASARDSNLVDVVVAPNAMVSGKTIKSLNFRRQFGAAVVAIKRGDHQLNGGLGQIRLRGGDLLILAVGDDFFSRGSVSQNFVVVGNRNQTTSSLSHTESLLFCCAALTALAASLASLLPLYKGLIVLLAIAIATKLTSIHELRRRFPFELVLVIGSALGLAQAISLTGLADNVASHILELGQHSSPFGAMVILYIATWLMTELITNNAAAAISFPIGLAIANQFNVDPLPFIMTVAFAASASFLSPFGYQTNLMVYSAGRYKPRDYFKAGLPLSICYGLGVIALVPVMFPW